MSAALSLECVAARADSLSPLPSRHPHQLLFSIPEAAPLLGRTPATLRREIERKSRPDEAHAEHVIALLAGGVRAFKLGKGGRWAVAIPLHLRG